MTAANRETREKQIHIAASVQARWEAERNFADHYSREQQQRGAERETRHEIYTLEGVLDTILGEWFELYEAVLQPEPIEAELLELSDIGAYALRFYTEWMRAQDENGVTYSEEEAAAATQLVSQAMLAGNIQEFPQAERTPEEKEVILADLRAIAVALLKTYVGLVAAETSDEEVESLVDAAHHFMTSLVTTNGSLTDEDQKHLKYIVMRPLIKDSPDGERGKTAIHSGAPMDLVLTGFQALEDFAWKHYGYEYFWILVASLYTPQGKNGLNYPHPLPQGIEDYFAFKQDIRNAFPGRVIPTDFDPHTDTPEAYLQRWQEQHPGEEFTIRARVPNFDGIAESLR